MSGFIYTKDDNNIVTITIDMNGPVNVVNIEYGNQLRQTVDRLEKEKGAIAGVVMTSAKETFVAGGDLNLLVQIENKDREEFFKGVEESNALLRSLEKLGKPVVAAFNGSALGGGLELGLACHHRIAINDRKVQIGLPEVTIGLMPGNGGIVRLVRMLGVEKALPLLLEGKRINPEKALALGIIDELAVDAADMKTKAIAWIKANPHPAQPWDEKGHQIPGGDLKHPDTLQKMQIAPSMLRKTTKGVYPAPEAILDVAVNSLRLDFDTAMRYSNRVFTRIVVTPVAKNMINTLFFQLNDVNGGASRPKSIKKRPVKKIGILGAGMMGQGIAYVSALANLDVVLKDISIEAAEKGKAYSEKLLDKAIKRGKKDASAKEKVLNRIKTTTRNEDLEGCDLIVEAIFENLDLKKTIIRETEPYITKNSVFGSNTSTLPITELAAATSRPQNFIGIHFFSPVDKMPLVEIIVGKKTSQETLALAFDYVRQIQKTPIVVNDARGFFTSRVFSSYMDEGYALLSEGVDPVLIDTLAQLAGMPVGPLAVQDEVSQELSAKAVLTNAELDKKLGGNSAEANPFMVKLLPIIHGEHNRRGRAYGAGFYEYPAGGTKFIWPELYKMFYKPEASIPYRDIKDRLLFRQIMTSLACLEESVLNSVRDGNIGSIMGIGFPPYTGGVFQYINTYGPQAFIQRSEELAGKYGKRFLPPTILKEKGKKNEIFL